jgi:hypothetical protein
MVIRPWRAAGAAVGRGCQEGPGEAGGPLRRAPGPWLPVTRPNTFPLHRARANTIALVCGRSSRASPTTPPAGSSSRPPSTKRSGLLVQMVTSPRFTILTGAKTFPARAVAALGPRDRAVPARAGGALAGGVRLRLPGRRQPRRHLRAGAGPHASNFSSIDSCTPVFYCCTLED